MGKGNNLEGFINGKLTGIKFLYRNNNRNNVWLAKCECGNEIEITSSKLKNRDSNESMCNECLKEYRLSQKSEWYGASRIGNKNKRLYDIWSHMRRRCNDINDKDYMLYGGRGIVVYNEWNEFSVFYKWALNSGYNDTLEIDRIDVNGNYEPSNCRWATRIEQCNNTRNNRVYTFNNETLTLKQWCDKLNLNYSTINSRINRGNWSIGRALGLE